jgi:hypothetical protein
MQSTQESFASSNTSHLLYQQCHRCPSSAIGLSTDKDSLPSVRARPGWASTDKDGLPLVIRWPAVGPSSEASTSGQLRCNDMRLRDFSNLPPFKQFWELDCVNLVSYMISHYIFQNLWRTQIWPTDMRQIYMGPNSQNQCGQHTRF